ncbi:hypothetical protein PA39016_000690003 [Pseudomonas aeruginosa 39016]|nr:hypothetical protein PA39016_000690003 [Pseudomonas aeruginosa 39016]
MENFCKFFSAKAMPTFNFIKIVDDCSNLFVFFTLAKFFKFCLKFRHYF